MLLNKYIIELNDILIVFLIKQFNYFRIIVSIIVCDDCLH